MHVIPADAVERKFRSLRREVALMVAAEMVVVADNQMLHTDASYEQVADELSRRRGCKLAGKGQHDHVVDAGLFQQQQFLRQGIEQFNASVQHFARMGPQGDDRRFASGPAGDLPHLVQQRTVSVMHAVERPYRHDGIRNGLQHLRITKYAHYSSSLLSSLFSLTK